MTQSRLDKLFATVPVDPFKDTEKRLQLKQVMLPGVAPKAMEKPSKRKPGEMYVAPLRPTVIQNTSGPSNDDQPDAKLTPQQVCDIRIVEMWNKIQAYKQAKGETWNGPPSSH